MVRQALDRLVRKRRSRRGFSAAELLVVLFIIGILTAISAPSMMTFFSSMKVRTAANRLMSHMRLCREMAVARRINVTMELQRTNGTTSPSYKAWEERSVSNANRLTRQANGEDSTANTSDDEKWIIKNEQQLALDRVKFTDSYNDTTPDNPSDAPGSSIMSSGGIMHLLFKPNGQVYRIDETTGADVITDTQIRMRMRRKINRTRVDQWDVTVNAIGKVGSNFVKDVPPE
jgi:prepilin-type N-terminal cleavage/methylation domain-containing protein